MAYEKNIDKGGFKTPHLEKQSVFVNAACKT